MWQSLQMLASLAALPSKNTDHRFSSLDLDSGSQTPSSKLCRVTNVAPRSPRSPAAARPAARHPARPSAAWQPPVPSSLARPLLRSDADAEPAGHLRRWTRTGKQRLLLVSTRDQKTSQKSLAGPTKSSFRPSPHSKGPLAWPFLGQERPEAPAFLDVFDSHVLVVGNASHNEGTSVRRTSSRGSSHLNSKSWTLEPWNGKQSCVAHGR